MKLAKDDLDWAAAQGLLSVEQVDPLWEALGKRAGAEEAEAAEAAPRARFDLLHVAYYFGALLVMGAMGFFMTIGWEAFGGGGIFAIASAYVLVFVLVGRSLWKKPAAEGLRVPAGLLFTMAVCIVPLAIYGLERATGLWPANDPGRYVDFHVYVRSGWLWMEVATVLAGLIALRSVRFPFLVAPVAFVLWYMSMDLAPALFGDLTWNHRALVSVVVGGLMLVAGYVVDRRTRDDFAFWLYLFGMMAFWGGLSSLEDGTELTRFAYLVINLALLVISALFDWRVFAVFGGFGVFGYLGYESWHTFQDSVAFPFALSGIGVLVLFGAVRFAKRRAEIERAIHEMTPAWLARHLPRARG